MSLNYNDYAVETAPASSIATSDTSIDVSDNTAYPNPPFLIDVFEGGNSPNDAVKQGGTVERMRVTATSGTGPYTWTVDRDYNGHNGSAQSFSTSASVWHVQPAKAIGPDRAVVQGQVIKPSSRLLAYDDFDRSDRSLSGDTLPSGQTWTSEDTTQAEIIDGRAVLSLDQSLGILRVPATMSANTQITIQARAQAFPTNGTGAGAIYYQDSNNWVANIMGTTGGIYKLRILLSDAGSISVENSINLSINTITGLELPFASHVRDSGFKTNVIFTAAGNSFSTAGGGGKIDSIMDNLTAVGLCNYTEGPARFENVLIRKITT